MRKMAFTFDNKDLLNQFFMILFKRFQHDYLFWAVLLVKINVIISAVMGYFYIETIIDLTSDQRRVVLLSLILGSLIFLGMVLFYLFSRTGGVSSTVKNLNRGLNVSKEKLQMAWRSVIDFPVYFFLFQVAVGSAIIVVSTIVVSFLEIFPFLFILHAVVAAFITTIIISIIDFFILEHSVVPVITVFHQSLRDFNYSDLRIVSIRFKIVSVVLFVVVAAFCIVGTLSYLKAADIAVMTENRIEAITDLRDEIVLIGLISSLTTAVLAILLAHSIHFPIVAVQHAIQGIAGGDLTQRVPIISKDEFGVLTNYLNTMTDSLERLANHIDESWHKLDDTSAILAMITNLQSGKLSEQANSVVSTTSTMEELATTTNQVADGAQKVVEIASSTETSSRKGLEAIEETTKSIRHIDQKNNETISRLSDLKVKFENIHRVMDLIRDIADRTKFIALNASIEAAGAGAMGKRFEVVAKEVRDLASKVSDAVQELRETIQEISTANNELGIASESKTHLISEGVRLTELTLESLNQIAQEAETTAVSARQISNAVIQQKTASDQMVTLLRDISDGIQEVAESGEDANSVTKELQELSHRLKTAIDIFKHHHDG